MTDVPDLAGFERLLYEHIPLASAMQVGVRAFDGETLTVHAPLAANRNHYGTAFGGSLYTVALVAGWGLARLLVAAPARVVVQSARADYKRPVNEDLTAIARVAGAGPAAIAAEFAARGKMRLDVEIRIADHGRPAFALHARFAARADSDA